MPYFPQKTQPPPKAGAGLNLLAIDTSTEWMSLAVQRAGQPQPWTHHAPGAALTSTQMITQIQTLMAQAGLNFAALDAIVLGAGPGSFTGLRSACAVAQGLAFGAGVPVLPVDTLLAVAEDARWQSAARDGFEVTALLDARMDEMYAASYRHEYAQWTTVSPCRLVKPEHLAPFPPAQPARPATHDTTADPEATRPTAGDSAGNPATARLPAANTPVLRVLAGNVFAVYGARLPDALLPRVDALPRAQALLRLAPALLAAGGAVAPAQALPTYVRDKVAQTTRERAAARLADIRP